MNSSRLSLMADVGVWLIRVGLGVTFVHYGAPMLFGGPDKWAQVGGAMQYFGISFAPVFWGFMAAFTEFFGGIFLALGLFTRYFSFLLLIVMIVAARMHFGKGEGFMAASHAVDNAIMFLGLTLIGPGRFSLDAWIRSFRK